MVLRNFILGACQNANDMVRSSGSIVVKGAMDQSSPRWHSMERPVSRCAFGRHLGKGLYWISWEGGNCADITPSFFETVDIDCSHSSRPSEWLNGDSQLEVCVSDFFGRLM